MKRIITAFISVVILMLSLMPMSAFAAEEKLYGEFLKYVIENGEAKITGHTDKIPTLCEIPSEIEGCKVTAIGEEAFYDTIGVNEFVLPDTIITIEKRAFNSCRGTTKINIPDGVKTIGDGAFGDCSEMLEAIIPDSVENFGIKVFKDCESLRNAKIPDHFTVIPESTFDYCEDLYDVVIPEGVTEIGESAFNECVDIVTINVPKSLKKVGEYAFYCCEELRDVYYSGTKEDWGKIVFAEHNEWLKNANIHFNSKVEEYVPAVPDETSSAAFTKDTNTEGQSDSVQKEQLEIVRKQNFKKIIIIAVTVAVVVIAAVVTTVVIKKKKSK
ncbi:MAG: leucine-rich repeat domain-containing protein [Clostridia bacterium]|nr:leucine-rich repeat domain-containing protein [Clostridia bacterium]